MFILNLLKRFEKGGGQRLKLLLCVKYRHSLGKRTFSVFKLPPGKEINMLERYWIKSRRQRLPFSRTFLLFSSSFGTECLHDLGLWRRCTKRRFLLKNAELWYIHIFLIIRATLTILFGVAFTFLVSIEGIAKFISFLASIEGMNTSRLLVLLLSAWMDCTSLCLLALAVSLKPSADTKVWIFGENCAF